MIKEYKKIRLIKKSNTYSESLTRYAIEVFSKGLFCKGKWIIPSIFEINGDRPKYIKDFGVLEFDDIKEANFVYDFLLINEYLNDDCIRIISGESLEDINKKAKVEDEILRCD
jgi:hypothetical protein